VRTWEVNVHSSPEKKAISGGGLVEFWRASSLAGVSGCMNHNSRASTVNWTVQNNGHKNPPLQLIYVVDHKKGTNNIMTIIDPSRLKLATSFCAMDTSIFTIFSYIYSNWIYYWDLHVIIVIKIFIHFNLWSSLQSLWYTNCSTLPN
jgi:hypothetical protein